MYSIAYFWLSILQLREGLRLRREKHRDAEARRAVSILPTWTETAVCWSLDNSGASIQSTASVSCLMLPDSSPYRGRSSLPL